MFENCLSLHRCMFFSKPYRCQYLGVVLRNGPAGLGDGQLRLKLRGLDKYTSEHATG